MPIPVRDMRQIAPGTNLVLAALAALGLLGTLGLPWYAPLDEDPNQYDGGLEHAAYRIAGVFRERPGAVSGGDALGDARVLLLGLVALVVVVCILTAVRPLRPYVRELVRVVALGLPAIVLYRTIDPPAAELTLHWGLLVSLAVAVFAASAAWHGGKIRTLRAPAGSWQRRPAG